MDCPLQIVPTSAGFGSNSSNGPPDGANGATSVAHHRRLFRSVFNYVRTKTCRRGNTAKNGIGGSKASECVCGGQAKSISTNGPAISERRNLMDYLQTRRSPAALRPALDLRLRSGMEIGRLDSAAFADPLALARMTFGTWVGGDRRRAPLSLPEGHTETADATPHRRSIVAIRNSFQLARRSSLSAYLAAAVRTSFLSQIAGHGRYDGPRSVAPRCARNFERTRATFDSPDDRETYRSIRLTRCDPIHFSDPSTSATRRNHVPRRAVGDYAHADALLADWRILYRSMVAVDHGPTADSRGRPG